MRTRDSWLRWLRLVIVPCAISFACGNEFQGGEAALSDDDGAAGSESTGGDGGTSGSTSPGGDGSGASAGEPGSAGDGASGGVAGASGTTGTGGDAGASPTGGVGGSSGASAGAGGVGALGGSTGAGTSGGGATMQGGAGAGGSAAGGSGGTSVGALYFEDFEDGAADGWNQTNMATGTWSVFADGANHVYRQGLQPTGVVWVIHATPSWADLRVQARVRFNTEFDVGAGRLHLAARYTSLDSYYRATVRLNGSASVSRNGTSDLVNRPVAVAVGDWHTLALSLVGTVVTLEYDGAVVGSATDTGPLIPAGGIALGVDHATVDVDDIVVTAP